jgi:Coenzyme PQQ synthesis protein D (PqqD)
MAARESLGAQRHDTVDLDARYELDAARVAAELVNDELVAIDFSTGKYHGIRGSGVVVWHLLETGFSPREIVEHLTHRVAGTDERAAQTVVAFVSELEAQGLVVRSTRAAPTLISNEETWPEPFAAPMLDTRDDLQDYLVLDPIHDVDERGWPNARR